MFYLTVNEGLSGVYQSQVLDVCRYLSTFEPKLRLVAFISLRKFFSQRKTIRNLYPGAICIPSFPGVHRWKYNQFLLSLFCKIYKPQSLICRGVLACNLALNLREKGIIRRVVYDGRGAYLAEWNEYHVVPHPAMRAGIKEWESRAVLESDHRIAVSEALVSWWQEAYGFEGPQPVVIPCTLNNDQVSGLPAQTAIEASRIARGYSPDDIIIVYSGSSAGWQSLVALDEMLLNWMETQPLVKVLLLTKLELNKLKIFKRFPERVARDWLSHEEVSPVMAFCDYGLLIREQSVTNSVASPTKFAEYLVAGLKVLISENLGDFTSFVKEHGCGIVVGLGEEGTSRFAEINAPILRKTTLEEKDKLSALAEKYFRKKAYEKQYKSLF